MAKIDISKYSSPMTGDQSVGEDVEVPLSDGTSVTLYTFMNLRASKQKEFSAAFDRIGAAAQGLSDEGGADDAGKDVMEAFRMFSLTREDTENLITLVAESEDAAERILDDKLYRPMTSLMSLFGDYMEKSMSGESPASGQS